jgi:hypothetical protein
MTDRIVETPEAALARIATSTSTANFATIIAAFKERGIPEDNILPRQNVLTFKAWKAVGRVVRKGEHGVCINVAIIKDVMKDGVAAKVMQGTKRVYVFHESQTDLIQQKEAA